ncbi:m159 protein [Murid betaherpesvirus 1]|uniref:M159 protein n=1 Tax=Murid herpesvirus 1 TaxID=10366 RepID=H2A2I5_MUHV1|nr:m159 protein [Murid betaherpesvirus 1]
MWTTSYFLLGLGTLVLSTFSQECLYMPQINLYIIGEYTNCSFSTAAPTVASVMSTAAISTPLVTTHGSANVSTTASIYNSTLQNVTTLPSTTPELITAVPSCRTFYNFSWGASINERDALLLSVNDNSTTTWTYGYDVGNTSQEVTFLQQHRDFMRDTAQNRSSNYLDETGMISVQITYDCCRMLGNGTVCWVRQRINGNLTDDFKFNNTYVSVSDDNGTFSVWINNTAMTSLWPHMNTIGGRWSSFVNYIRRLNTLGRAVGYTKVINATERNSTVKCFVRTSSPFDIQMSWLLDGYEIKPRGFYWMPDGVGGGVGRIKITLPTDDVHRLSCLVSSPGKWASFMVVPYPYGPLPMGSEVPVMLVAAIVAVLVVFLMIGCIGFCSFVCERRLKTMCSDL